MDSEGTGQPAQMHRLTCAFAFAHAKRYFFLASMRFVVYDIILENLCQRAITENLQITINYDLLASSRKTNEMMYCVCSATESRDTDKSFSRQNYNLFNYYLSVEMHCGLLLKTYW